MKIDEIRSKTDDELSFELDKAKKELFELRMKASTQSIQSPAEITNLRREIARMNTILHERAIGLRGQEPR
jgi:large subunit ribosomal protein L29